MGYIYKIQNTVSGKCYIGQTRENDPEERWKGHLRAIERGKGCPALADAISKYGLEVFKFSVLIICFDEDLDAYEREYIAKFNSMTPNGYNILEGGVGGAGFKGKKHSADSRALISSKIKISSNKPEYLKMLSERVKKHMASLKEKGVDFGKIVRESENYQKALQEGRVGGGCMEHTEESKKKISESLKKYYEMGNAYEPCVNIKKLRKAMAIASGKKVYKVSKDGSVLNEYISMNECARQLEISKGTVTNWVNKKRKFDDDSYLSLVGPDGATEQTETI